jgi:hypothetical protein
MLMLSGASRSLRLVVKSTGEDVGVFVDWQTAYVDAVNAPVDIRAHTVYYGDTGCSGVAMVVTGDARYVGSSLGRIIERTQPIGQDVTAKSQMTPAGLCVDSDVPLADNASLARVVDVPFPIISPASHRSTIDVQYR